MISAGWPRLRWSNGQQAPPDARWGLKAIIICRTACLHGRRRRPHRTSRGYLPAATAATCGVGDLVRVDLATIGYLNSMVAVLVGLTLLVIFMALVLARGRRRREDRSREPVAPSDPESLLADRDDHESRIEREAGDARRE